MKADCAVETWFMGRVVSMCQDVKNKLTTFQESDLRGFVMARLTLAASFLCAEDGTRHPSHCCAFL
jgi:hypothetical protein